MSKAFVRESDDEPEEPAFSRPGSPPGAKNYLTAGGERRLREELARLTEVERPRIAALADEKEQKRARQAVNQRIRQIEDTLRTAEIIPADGPTDRVRLGATVTVREGDGSESDYRLVGTEEADFGRGWVSWQSPMAKALLNARVGEKANFNAPSGRIELEIVRVRYE